MKISCDVIRDLLPLYAGDKASKGSIELVDEHLGTCEACARELRALTRSRNASDRSSPKRSAAVVRLLRLLPTITVVLAVLTILAGIAAVMVNPIWLTAEEAVISVEEVEHGGVRFVLQNYVSDHSVTSWGNDYGHAWSTTRFDKLLSQMGIRIEDYKIVDSVEQEYITRGAIVNDAGGVESYEPELAEQYGVTEMMTEKNHWYENVYAGELDVLLWDAGKPAPKESPIDKEWLLLLNFCGAIALTGLCPICAHVLKKKWLNAWMPRIAVLTGSIVVSTLLVTGGRFVTVCVRSEPYSTLKWIYLIAVLATLTVLSAQQLHKLKKQQKNQ